MSLNVRIITPEKVFLTSGLGPTKLMSPFKIFKICGSSFIFVLRRNLPGFVTLQSPARVIEPEPKFGESLSIVANFIILKVTLFIPILSWK